MQEWYVTLAKPVFAPPAELFGPVWTVLYVIIAVSFGYVFYQIARRRIPVRVGVPFALNLLCNLSFTPVTFGLRNLEWGSVLVIGVLVTLIWSMVVVWPHARWVAYAQVPYVLWVTFASILQLSITFMN